MRKNISIVALLLACLVLAACVQQPVRKAVKRPAAPPPEQQTERDEADPDP
jgi:hypothetical protein